MAAVTSGALHVMAALPGRDRALVRLAATGDEPRERCADARKCRVHDRGGDRQDDDWGEHHYPASPEEVAGLAVAIPLARVAGLAGHCCCCCWCLVRRAVRAGVG